MCQIWSSNEKKKKFSNTRIVAEQAGEVWFGTDWAHLTNIWTTLKILQQDCSDRKPQHHTNIWATLKILAYT